MTGAERFPGEPSKAAILDFLRTLLDQAERGALVSLEACVCTMSGVDRDTCTLAVLGMLPAWQHAYHVDALSDAICEATLSPETPAAKGRHHAN